AIYEKLGIRERAENMMQYYFDKGFASLEQLEGEEQAKVLMRAFFNYLINREK
ncbi:MAG: geranylgeranyl diphosphate synthase type II, partial [Marivirga sp.]